MARFLPGNELGYDSSSAAMAVSKELLSIPDFGNDDDAPFAIHRRSIANFKKSILMVAGAAVQKFMMKIDQEQEIIMNIADMAIETYPVEARGITAVPELIDDTDQPLSAELLRRMHASRQRRRHPQQQPQRCPQLW